MWRYWTLLTDLRASEIAQMQADVATGALHPMQAKKNLAHLITTGFHTPEEADAAAESWAKQFQQRSVVEDAPLVRVSLGEDGLLAVPAPDSGTFVSTNDPTIGTSVKMTKLLVLAGLAASANEANRKLKENAVSVNGEKYGAAVYNREALGSSPTLRLGKKSVRVEWTD